MKDKWVNENMYLIVNEILSRSASSKTAKWLDLEICRSIMIVDRATLSWNQIQEFFFVLIEMIRKSATR